MGARRRAPFLRKNELSIGLNFACYIELFRFKGVQELHFNDEVSS